MTLLSQILLGCMGAILVGLVILYLTRPRYEDIQLSVAQFLAPNDVRQTQARISLRNLVSSLPFYFQFATLLILLVSLIPLSMCQPQPEQTIGLWMIIDTSASMSTQQEGETRMMLALREAQLGEAHIEQIARENDIAVCSSVTTFDLDWHHHTGELDEIKHRPVGTRYDFLRNLLKQPPTIESDCQLTHALIITDQGPKDFIDDETMPLTIIWRDISQPVDHVGITAITSFRNPLTWTTEEVALEVVAYGQPPALSDVQVTDQFGTQIELAKPAIIWRQEQSVAQVSFNPTVGGEYRIVIGDETDPYIYDNTAVIVIPPPRLIEVDWQIEDRSVFELLQNQGWQLESDTPDLRVIPIGGVVDDVPTLIVGNQYEPNQTLTEIGYFRERDDLVEDLNFDVAETLLVNGVTARQLPENFEQILGNQSNGIWLGQRLDPPAIFVPGLPTFSEGNEELYAFSTTSFFNGVRWLLEANEPVPLYTLTSDSQPDPEGNRISLHLGEGDTDKPPVSAGSIEDIVPIEPLEVPAVENWPLFLAMACVLFFIERLASIWGGPRWN